jgi:hypothetical protein
VKHILVTAAITIGIMAVVNRVAFLKTLVNGS